MLGLDKLPIYLQINCMLVIRVLPKFHIEGPCALDNPLSEA